MKTKSRYEVIAELETKKRDLIRERDSLDDEARKKEQNVKLLERQKEDIDKQFKDFDLRQNDAMEDLSRKKKDFEFRIENTKDDLNRKIEDARADLIYFKSTIIQKIETIKELIKGVDESLERFGKIQVK